MENSNLPSVQKQNFFSKIKNWFRNLFGTNTHTNKVYENDNVEELKFEQDKSYNKVPEQTITQKNNLQYDFTNGNVSRQKLQKAKLDLDNRKIGIEELYSYSDEELNELKKMYEGEIGKTINELNKNKEEYEKTKRRYEKLKSMSSSNVNSISQESEEMAQSKKVTEEDYAR